MRLIVFTLIIIGLFSCSNSKDKKMQNNSFKFQRLANPENNEPVPFETLRTFKDSIYNIKCEITKDSIIISANFIDSHCREFSGKDSISNDILFLNFYQSNELDCLTYCIYKMTYSTINDKHDWKEFRIIQK